MAFKLIDTNTTGSYQVLLNRLIANPETIDLSNTPDGDTVGSFRSIPLDGANEELKLDSGVVLKNTDSGVDVGSVSAENLAFDLWIYPSSTSIPHNTFFNISVMNSGSATVSGFDGIYSGHVVSGGFVNFRIDHDRTYSITSTTALPLNQWAHVYCEWAQAASTMKTYINGVLDSNSANGGGANTLETNVDTTLGGVGNLVSFNGTIDELRLWQMSGAASAIQQIASLSGIGRAPENFQDNVGIADNGLNEFTPSADTLVGWWRLDSTSAFQLFSALTGSIQDYTQYGHNGDPIGFEGSDQFSEERTVIDGISASGDLISLSGGDIDHGGLSFVDLNNDRVKLVGGVQNLVNAKYNNWTTTGGGVNVTIDTKNIFYGSSSIRINTTTKDTGITINLSNSAVLYDGNTYTMSMRLRSVTGSSSARITFQLGQSTSTVTASLGVFKWEPIVIPNTMRVEDRGASNHSGSLTGNITVTVLDRDALIRLDGLQVNEGDFHNVFTAPDRIRKSSQLFWEILD